MRNKSNGITLVALVITIIVLLILAGVTVSTLTGDNGILNKAVTAKNETEISSEREAIQLTRLQKVATHEEKYNIGQPLYDKTLENGDKWKIISMIDTNKIYGNGYIYIPKGCTVENYGNTKKSWIINESTEELILLEEGKYIELAYGENLAVKDNIILNVDPINMSDENSWGNGVTLYGVQEDDGYGWNGSEFKFDGIDDYIEIYTDMALEKGITFEFYAKSESELTNMLCKTVKDPNDRMWSKRFRSYFEKTADYNRVLCCMSGFNSNSPWILNAIDTHWICKNIDEGSFSNSGAYLTMAVNLENDTISLYWNGKHIGSTKCSHDWLVNGTLTDKNIPFTVGLMISGSTYEERYSKMDLYACRLYGKVLSEKEIEDNYNATVAYHNLLKQ